MVMSRESIPARGEVVEKWEGMGINRKRIPTVGMLGERWEDIGIS